MPFKYETEKRKDNRGQPYARKQSLPNWNSLPILRAHCRLVQIFGIKRHKLPFIIILYIEYIYKNIMVYASMHYPHDEFCNITFLHDSARNNNKSLCII